MPLRSSAHDDRCHLQLVSGGHACHLLVHAAGILAPLLIRCPDQAIGVNFRPFARLPKL